MTPKYDLVAIAKQTMIAKGLQPDYPQAVTDQLKGINAPAALPNLEDSRKLLWCSIDNDDSKDLDQLTYAQDEANGQISLWVAVADVDALVAKDSPIDNHAQVNTTTVYTPSKNFAMLPEKLSTNLTSLNEKQERAAVVVKMLMNPSGDIVDASIHHATVYNYAQLTYNAVGAWLEGKGAIPEKVAAIKGLEENLTKQSLAAQILRKKRYELGALTLETIEAVPVFQGEEIVGLEPATTNKAHQLIEHFMIATNTSIARYFAKAKIPSLRRVVRVPKRWDRIVEVAQEKGETLPAQPDSKALDAFLIKMRDRDPEAFPDLSLTIVKLLGSGEYVVEVPGDNPVGHFGLALKEYTHSTAPNRRYPDVITQRQIKNSLWTHVSLYQTAELEKLAYHCTVQEDAAAKVERQMRKSAAAILLSNQIGTTFQGIITGSSDKGTWVRIFKPATEGRIIKNGKALDVGDKVQVKLVGVDVEKGYIDFAFVQKI